MKRLGFELRYYVNNSVIRGNTVHKEAITLKPIRGAGNVFANVKPAFCTRNYRTE